MLQGTLDMLILQTLVIGPGHAHSIAHSIERGSDEILQLALVLLMRNCVLS